MWLFDCFKRLDVALWNETLPTSVLKAPLVSKQQNQNSGNIELTIKTVTSGALACFPIPSSSRFRPEPECLFC